VSPMESVTKMMAAKASCSCSHFPENMLLSVERQARRTPVTGVIRIS
jgi:hypothetical protein